MVPCICCICSSDLTLSRFNSSNLSSNLLSSWLCPPPTNKG